VQMVLVSLRQKVVNVSTVERRRHRSGDVTALDIISVTPVDFTRKSMEPTAHCRNYSPRR